jgi:murein DD-endopeptidase MepM/ murein hydrolase activator NlpD
MDKKIKFSEQPKRVKIIYASVVAILCVTAVVIGIVSAASRKNNLPDSSLINPPVTDNTPEDNAKPPNSTPDNQEPAPKPLTFVSPLVGEIVKGHSLEVPVFSNTLNEWRVHTGIDISADEGSDVYASANGTVTKVYNDPFLGKTVEITHTGNIVSVYSNLDNNGVVVKVGDKVNSGDKIGIVGDTSLSELADESHLHFAIKVDGVSVNPLDYISEDSKKASLGITDI